MGFTEGISVYQQRYIVPELCISVVFQVIQRRKIMFTWNIKAPG
jgi:hypothetical protein